MKRNDWLIFVCVTMAALLAFSPKNAAAFDWPAGAALAQKLQVIKQEIENAKTLILRSQSKKPITAASYLAVDLSTNAMLLKKNPDQAYPIASVTKLMNAAVVLENIDTAKTVTLTQIMLAPEGGSPSIYKGLKISVHDLLQASLTQSVNDAAESLAYTLGKDKFLNLMNQKAKDLKMTKTAYSDAHGLSAKNKSSAADLAKLLAYIYKKRPEILTATKNNNFWLPDKTGTLLKFQNMNNFYNVPEFIGGKSGYSLAARQTFAAIFKVKEKPVAIVLLNSADFQADTFKIISQLKN